MRAHFITALSLVVSGCVSVTTAGTEEALLFSPRDAQAEDVRTVLTPYNDLPLSIEFACPDRLAAMSTFRVIPLPPVIPMGFVNDDVSYVRIRMPEGAENALAQTRVVTPAGKALPLSDARQSKRNVGGDNPVEVTYALDRKCEDLDGATLEVSGFSYGNKRYPAADARLRFESKIKHAIAWSAHGIFNGGHAATGGTDAIRPATK